MLFPGAHADVGRGYTTRNGESGLSNGALLWMMERLQSVGVRFSPEMVSARPADPAGTTHQPWRHPPFNTPGKAAPRHFRGSGLAEHPSIAACMGLPDVVAEAGEPPRRYAPTNRP